MRFWCVVSGSFENVFGNKPLCDCVYILMFYMVIWALIALEVIKILFGLHQVGMEIWDFGCVLKFGDGVLVCFGVNWAMCFLCTSA